MSLNVILADDHPIVRVSIANEVLRTGGMSVVAEVSSPDELIVALKMERCDVLVTDFSMPGAEVDDGLSLISLIQQSWPDIRIIVLTMLSNAGLISSMRMRQVAGLVSKADALDELGNALRAIKAGDSYISSTFERLLSGTRASSSRDPRTVLSERELEVLRLFASGLSISEIAARRGRSVKTVSHQKMSAMGKLGLRNDPELYTYAHEHGLS